MLTEYCDRRKALCFCGRNFFTASLVKKTQPPTTKPTKNTKPTNFGKHGSISEYILSKFAVFQVGIEEQGENRLQILKICIIQLMASSILSEHIAEGDSKLKS